MRPSLLIAAGAALALGLVVEFLPAPQTPPQTSRVALVSLPPAAAAAATVTADAAPAPPSPAPAAAPQPVPDLPTVAVTPHPEHTVPGYSAPPQPVTFPDPPPRAATDRPPRAASPSLAVSGAAQLGRALSLRVEGRTVSLFGVRLPPSGDRCVAAGSRVLADCGAVARAALEARLGGHRRVSCRVPPGQRGHRDAAICLDAAGVDLGGFLIAQGLALADRSASYDYVGAEGVARSLHRGLWRYR